MKKLNQNKKLSLEKLTIAKLDNKSLATIMGAYFIKPSPKLPGDGTSIITGILTTSTYR